MEQEKVTFRELSNFFPKQMQGVELSEVFDYLLYGGTLGGGKSRWIRWIALYWLMKWYEETGITGIRAGVFCEDYPSLNDRHLAYVKEEFPSWLGKFNEQRHEFKLAPEYGNGVIAFRNLDDAEKYLSVEFAFEGIDEINRNPFETFNKLRRRLRWPGINRPKLVGACNPVGEAWVRDMWIDRLFPPEFDSIKDQFYFLESKPQDNPYLSQKYYEDLKTQDPTFVKAALDGDWHAYDEFMDKDGYMPIINATSVSRAQIIDSEHSGIRAICIDPAAGGDESAIVLCSETCKQVLFSQKLENTMSLVSLAIRYREMTDADVVVIDKTGLGKPLYDRLKELRENAIGVDFGDKPDDELRFKNNKAELIWLDKEWILKGGKLVKHVRWSEWNAIKYKVSSDGIIEIESKDRLRKRGLPSPDVVEAGALFQAIDLKSIKRKKNREKFGQPVFRDNITDIWKK